MMCPFVVIADSREQSPFAFDSLRTDAAQGRQPLTVPILRRGIPSGDYSIDGHEDAIAIERKSLPDLFLSVGRGRRRFKREIERLASMRFAAVICEADWHTVLSEPPPRSQLSPKIIFRTIIAWQIQFPSVHWWMCPGRRFAELTTFRLLERFWKTLNRNRSLNQSAAATEMKAAQPLSAKSG